MSQQISSGTKQNARPGKGTESIIHEAFLAASARRITLNPSFLDDEKLPESERVAVLQEVFHRNIRSAQIERLAKHMAPALGGDLPSNLLIYGPSGAGKSVTCLHFLSTLAAMCAEKRLAFHYAYVDMTTPRTCFGALNEMAIALDGQTRRYRKGIALQHMQDTIVAALQESDGMVAILVDEVDNVTADGDLFFTFLVKTLPKRARARLCYIFLTNRLEWEKNLDPRILSVMKKTDMIFEPYNALDLVEILNLRVEKALDREKVDPASIRKIAAYASRETGDARRAVELLAKAVKIAEETSGRLSEAEVDRADSLLEVDKTVELIATLATQQRLALASCYHGLRVERGALHTGRAYQVYRDVCARNQAQALSQRRFADIVSFLDLYGLVNARVISKGRYGKTRQLSGSLPGPIVESLLAGMAPSRFSE